MRSRLSRLPRSKKMRVVNNYQKPCVFTWFSHARACAHSFKIVRKSFPTRLSNKSRDRSLSKDCFFGLSSLKSLHERPPGCFWRPPMALLGYLRRSWATLGALLSALGALWGALGATLGGPKSIQKSIRKSIRNRAGSGSAKNALELRLSMFQSWINLSGNRLRALEKAIKTAIDMISSYLSIY